MTVAGQLAALLVAGDPHGAAERTLGFLVSLNKARSGAAFAVVGDRVSVFAGRGLDVEAISLVQAAWAGQRRALEAGEALPQRTDQSSSVILPLRDGDRVVALLYLGGGADWTAPELGSVAEFGVAIAQAVVAAATGPQESPLQAYLASTSEEQIARERLLLLLHQNEWNISRVARLEGVTRRTIYLRLERYGITRQRVPKATLRPARKAIATA